MNILKATSCIAAALLAAGATAGAQEIPPTWPVTYLRPVTFPVFVPSREEPAQEQTSPQLPVPPAPAASSDRRDDIRTLEAVLTLAVKNGADKLALQMR